MMESAKGKSFDSLFCDLCGTVLSFTSRQFTACRLCNSHLSLADYKDKVIWFTTTAEELTRRLGFEPIIFEEESEIVPVIAEEEEEPQEKAVVNDDCPKCDSRELKYYTRQLRSADEGQTVFYECPKCEHKFSQHM